MNKFIFSTGFVSLLLVLMFSCKSDSSGSDTTSGKPEAPGSLFQSATATPPYPRVDISKLRPLSFREIYQFGVKNQGIFHFPVYDELGNEIPSGEIGKHFQASSGMIMYADERGEVKAGLIRKLSESEIKEILQIAREMQSNTASSDSSSIKNQ